MSITFTNMIQFSAASHSSRKEAQSRNPSQPKQSYQQAMQQVHTTSTTKPFTAFDLLQRHRQGTTAVIFSVSQQSTFGLMVWWGTSLAFLELTIPAVVLAHGLRAAAPYGVNEVSRPIEMKPQVDGKIGKQGDVGIGASEHVRIVLLTIFKMLQSMFGRALQSSRGLKLMHQVWEPVSRFPCS